MIIFINEERPYSSWLARHRNGFVVDALRKPTRKQPILHRAACPEIKRCIKNSNKKKTHWTTGRHVKACSLDAEELRAWVQEEFGADAADCGDCRPELGKHTDGLKDDSADHPNLTKLGKEIVDCVLDVAVVRLDGGEAGYTLTLAGIAEFLGKTPAQLTTALLRLMDDEYLEMVEAVAPVEEVPVDRTIYPTTKALRTLPAFRKMRRGDVEKERQALFAVRT